MSNQEFNIASTASTTASTATADKPFTIYLDGNSLTPEQVVDIGYHPGKIHVELTEEAWSHVKRARDVVERVLARKEVAYGINTGFGNFANVIIPAQELAKLQANLIRSHAAGVGEPLNVPQTRMLMVLRANVLAKGHSGVRPITLQKLLKALNLNCLPYIPSKGTVGASGDLAPLSHLALGLMGEGQMYDPIDHIFKPALQVLTTYGLEPIDLTAKEGLALINGTQLITSIGCDAVVRAMRVARQADVIAAITLEALHGSVRPFHPAVHAVRPHKGQQLVAARLRSLLNFGQAPSQIMSSHVNCGKVQDSYTMRCVPQIHGISHDTLAFVYDILKTECNSATDNPMIFADLPANQAKSRSHSLGDVPAHDDMTQSGGNSHSHQHSHGHSNHSHEHDHSASNLVVSSLHAAVCPSAATLVEEEKEKLRLWTASQLETKSVIDEDEMGMIISGGNFHGEYPAKALDYLAIAIHEMAAVSERRIERLVNPHLSALPAFLVKQGGLNSGFMIAHCTAAALVSENKVLCHPASVDSLSTSAAQEDHVSMGGMAARKALTVVQNVETVLAIELLAAIQGIEFSAPLKTTFPLEAVHAVVRSVVQPWNEDRFMTPDIEAAVKLLREEKVWESVKPTMDRTLWALSDDLCF